MHLAVIADTHLPRGRRVLPDACVARLRAADLIVHAGDLVAAEVLEELAAFGPVAAVHGNVDEGAVRAALPERLDLELEGIGLGVIHDAGPRSGRLRRLRALFPEAAAVIFGHSHIPLLEVSEDGGFQIFNPGSPTDKRRQPVATMGWAEIAAGAARFEIIPLDG